MKHTHFYVPAQTSHFLWTATKSGQEMASSSIFPFTFCSWPLVANIETVILNGIAHMGHFLWLPFFVAATEPQKVARVPKA